MENFRSHGDAKEFSGQRRGSGRAVDVFGPADCGGGSLPGSVSAGRRGGCRRAMMRIYGTNNGFDWKLGDTVGAQIVSVPMSVPLNIADRAFRTLMIYLCGLGLAALILLDLAMVWIVIRPVSRLSALADEVSNGNFNVPEIPVKGSDEISDLARSFNRMYVSMVKAMRMLES